MRSIRFCRFVDRSAYARHLESANDALPVLVTQEQETHAARSLGPELASAEPGRVISLPMGLTDAVGCHVVLAPAAGRTTALAKRYAAWTGRRFASGDATDLAAMLGPEALASLTWFCEPGQKDRSAGLLRLLGELAKTQRSPVRLGLITAEDHAVLSWVVAKQVLAVPVPARSEDALVLSMERVKRPPSSVAVLGRHARAAETVEGVYRASGPLFIDGHARPHCGVLPVSDGAVGICGLRSGGRAGRCVQDTHCHFGDARKAVLEELRTTRLFFNGCTTAGTGTTRTDFVTDDALICHAALRGRVREYLGNTRPGYYNADDIDWFLAGSALGYSAAECVPLVEAARARSGREVLPSLMYVGDPLHAAWPAPGATLGEVCNTGDGVQVRFARIDRVGVARLPGRAFAQLAAEDRLSASVHHSSKPNVTVVADPWNDASLLCVLPRLPFDPQEPLVLELGERATALDREAGDALREAVENLRWVTSLPTFRRFAHGVVHAETELVQLRRMTASRASLTLSAETLAQLDCSARTVASSLDAALVGEGARKSQTPWPFAEELGSRGLSEPSTFLAGCPGCGATTTQSDVVDLVNPKIRRIVRACAFCGVVFDMPRWALRVTMGAVRSNPQGTEVTTRVVLRNAGSDLRHVAASFMIQGAGEVAETSVRSCERELSAGQTVEVPLSLHPLKTVSGVMQARLFVASQGGFGIATRIVLLGVAERVEFKRTEGVKS